MKNYIFTDQELIHICKLADNGLLSDAYEGYNDLPTGAKIDTLDYINFIESFFKQLYFYRKYT